MIQHRLSGINPPTQASDGMPNEKAQKITHASIKIAMGFANVKNF